MNSSSSNELIKLLNSDNRHARAVAAIQLGQQNNKDVLPTVCDFVNDEDDMVAIAGMYACWRLGEDKISIERMIHALNSDDEDTIQLLIQVVSDMGDSLIPKFDLIENPPTQHIIHMLILLEEIGSESALSLIKSIKSDDPEVLTLIKNIVNNWEDNAPGELD